MAVTLKAKVIINLIALLTTIIFLNIISLSIYSLTYIVDSKNIISTDCVEKFNNANPFNQMSKSLSSAEQKEIALKEGGCE